MLDTIETVEIKVKVFKECRTCKFINFLDDWATAICKLNDEVVIEDAFTDDCKEKEPCEKWEFDYSLFEETDCNFIDLTENKKIS